MSSRPKMKLAALVIAAAVAGALLSLPFASDSVHSVFVSQRGVATAPQEYSLSVDDSASFVQALRGEVVTVIPGNVRASYSLKVSPMYMLPRAYEVFITEDREVYFKRPMINRITRSAAPEFFFRHDAFLSLYTDSAMPETHISVGEIDLLPLVSLAQWQFKKWDDNWYEGSTQDSSYTPSDAVKVTDVQSVPLLSLALPADEMLLTVTGPDGRIRFSEIIGEGNLPLIPFNGTYQYELSVFWRDEDLPYRGEYHASFPVYVELPPVFRTPGPMIVQGELATFYALHMPEGVTPLVETDMTGNLRLFPYEDGFVAYIPTHYGTKPAEYTFSYGLPGEELTQSKVAVVTREFHIQYMTISPSVQAATQNPEAYAEYNRYFPQSRLESSPDRYYTEPFILPVGYSRLTTEFGQTRYVNNAPTASRHSGLDMAAPTGTPVLATNRGRVSLARHLILTGNTLVIDHGQGLFSVHFHMSEF